MEDARDEQGEYKSFEEEIYWRHIRRISFYTTFRSDSTRKLQIPKKFAEIIRSNLLHPKMTLRGPSGASWEVDLIRLGDDLFLQQGWQEFANSHSLQENDILIFKFDRNSTFSVKIFSGECEKIAAYFVRKCGHACPTDENDEVCTATKKPRISKKILSSRKRVQSAITLVRKKAASSSMMGKQAEAEADKQHELNSLSNDQVPIGSGSQNIAHRAETERDKERERNSLNNEQVPHQSSSKNIALPAKRAAAEHSEQQEQNIVLPVTRGETGLGKKPVISIKKELISPDMENVTSPATRGRRTTSLHGPADIECISNRRAVTDEEKTNAMRKAVAELTENSFVVALPISSCYKYFSLTIPASFARAHLGLRNQEVHLCMGKKKWITKFSFSKGALCAGWKKFAVSNNLEESDVCLFKLVNHKSGELPVMLDVAIFRVVDEVTPPTLSFVK